MSNTLKSANAAAWRLALLLMVTVVVFQAEDGRFGVLPSADYDGEACAILHEFDPFA